MTPATPDAGQRHGVLLSFFATATRAQWFWFTLMMAAWGIYTLALINVSLCVLLALYALAGGAPMRPPDLPMLAIQNVVAAVFCRWVFRWSGQQLKATAPEAIP